MLPHILFLLFPCCRGEAGDLLHRCTATTAILFYLSQFYYPFLSPFYFKGLRQSSHLCCPCFFDLALSGNLSSLILTVCPKSRPSQFSLHSLLFFLTNQARVPISSPIMSFMILLSNLFSSHYLDTVIFTYL